MMLPGAPDTPGGSAAGEPAAPGDEPPIVWPGGPELPPAPPLGDCCAQAMPDSTVIADAMTAARPTALSPSLPTMSIASSHWPLLATCRSNAHRLRLSR